MIKKQFDDIRRNGLGSLLHKLFVIGVLCSAIAPLVLVRLLRPFIVIRFGRLASHGFTRYIAEPELYLSERDAGIHKLGRFVDLFYHENCPWIIGNSVVSNYQVKRMLDRTLHVFRWVGPIAELNDLIPGGARHTVPWRRDHQEKDIHRVLDLTESHFEFTSDEEQVGQKWLRTMGILQGEPFICFEARDWQYEVSRGTDINLARLAPSNADIYTYMPALQRITEKGMFAFRLGAAVATPLLSDDPRIIDYATTDRSDFLDLYLGANCRFLIGGTGGVTAITTVFRKPTVHLNYVAFDEFPIWLAGWQSQDLVIPKLIWSVEHSRILSLREIFVLVQGGSSWLQNPNIRLEDNTEEDVKAVVVEMEERLNGTWQPMVGDDELQIQFWSALGLNREESASYARIGAEFIRSHQGLLK